MPSSEMYILNFVHTRVLMLIYTCTHSSALHTHVHTYTHACTHARIHTHTHACTHACIHTHTRACTQQHTHTYRFHNQPTPVLPRKAIISGHCMTSLLSLHNSVCARRPLPPTTPTSWVSSYSEAWCSCYS